MQVLKPAFILLLCSLVACGAGYKEQVKIVMRNIEGKVGENTIREWAMSVMDKHRDSFGTNLIVQLQKSEIPDWLPQLDNTFPFLSAAAHSPTSQYGESVWAVWASGRGSIGITVARRSDQVITFGDNYYWKQPFPGIYVWVPKRV